MQIHVSFNEVPGIAPRKQYWVCYILLLSTWPCLFPHWSGPFLKVRTLFCSSLFNPEIPRSQQNHRYGWSHNTVNMWIRMIHCPTSMWELDHQEGWVQKNWCFSDFLLEKTLSSPFDSKEIKLVNPKGNQPWTMIGRTDAEAEAPIVWPPDAKEPAHWKRPCCWERLEARGEVGSRGWDG